MISRERTNLMDERETAVYYHDIDSVTGHLMKIVRDQTMLHSHTREQLNRDLTRQMADHWDVVGNTLYIKLELGTEDCTVKVCLNHDKANVVAVCDGMLHVYELSVAVNWCSSEFDLPRAMVHVQLHQEAVQLMATIQNSFAGMIGRLVPNE